MGIFTTPPNSKTLECEPAFFGITNWSEEHEEYDYPPLS